MATGTRRTKSRSKNKTRQQNGRRQKYPNAFQNIIAGSQKNACQKENKGEGQQTRKIVYSPEQIVKTVQRKSGKIRRNAGDDYKEPDRRSDQAFRPDKLSFRKRFSQPKDET